MAKEPYESPRPHIPAEVSRAAFVECGHTCAIPRCGEHTYLELHHINGNREDNRVENLLALCDKHHKMAHAGVIDRKALAEYKRLLKNNYFTELQRRIERLEKLVAQAPKAQEDAEKQKPVETSPELASKRVTPRSEVTYRTIDELALSRFERDHGFFLEREPVFSKGSAKLQLDAVRQDDSLERDIIVEVRWIRKRYLDGPIWVRQVTEATSAYELLTGRRAKGVLIFVVPKSGMKSIDELFYTKAEMEKVDPKPELVFYSYEDLNFTPASITADVFSKKLNS